MERYRNLGGDSNVAAYEIGDDYVRVRFNDGATYVYTYASAGRANVERAKRLAEGGVGLNSHVNLNMRKLYASKA